MNLKRKNIVVIFTFIALSILLIGLFYRPHHEWSFIKKVEAKFNESSSEYVLLKHIIEKEWTVVCFIPPKSIFLVFGSTNAPSDSVLNKSIPSFRWPFYQGSFLFFNETKPIESYSLNTLGYRLVRGKILRMGFDFFINEKQYSFWNEHGSANDFCIPREYAAFKKVQYENFGASQVLITNISKE